MITQPITDPTAKLNELIKRAGVLRDKRVGFEKELELLKKQYAEKLQELKDLGVDDLSNLPQAIADLKADIEARLAALEIEIKAAEEAAKEM
jgi:predicted  nucleic acid-binding Zn-ribbon protein